MLSLVEILSEKGKYTDWKFKDIEPWELTKDEFMKFIDVQKWSKPLLNVFEKNWLEKNLKQYQYNAPENYTGFKKIKLIDKFAGEKYNQDGLCYILNGVIKGVIIWDDKKDLDIFVVSKDLRGKGIGTKLLDKAVNRYGVKYKKNLLYEPSAKLIHRLEVKWAYKSGKPIPAEVLKDYPYLMNK